MKRGPLTIIIVILVVLIGAWFYFANYSGAPSGGTTQNNPSSTLSTDTLPTANVPVFDKSISDGTITLSYPSADFGLATNQAQILTKTVIPPCDQNFNYCLYSIGSAYSGTNFESAGIRIQHRTALNTAAKCLTTPPAGFIGLKPIATATSTDYSVSVFSPLDNAGAGHTAGGSLYRLSYGGTCYEFETRIGKTQFANYPSGTIQEFSDGDASALESEIATILTTLTLPNGETVRFR